MEFHPDAKKNFDRKAIQLLQKLSDCSDFKNRARDWSPEIPLIKLEPGEIKDIKYGIADYRGKETAKYFTSGDQILGFKNDDYNSFLKLARAIQKTNALVSTVSVNFVKENLFEWVQLRYHNLIRAEFISFLIQKCTEQVKELEIWIPIAFLFLESDLRIGRIELTTLTSEILNKWHADASKDKERSSKDTIDKLFERLKNDIGACAAGVMRITAEPERAYEIALSETENCLGFLRIFSSATILPDQTSYCIVLGSKDVGITRLMAIEDGSLILMKEKRQVSGTPEWELSNDKIQELRCLGLDILNNVYQKENKTDFQRRILTALKLYSRSSIARDVAEKLIYIFAALELVFLKDSSEPIQQNVSERMAIFMGGSISKKRQVVSNFKKVYALRSSFVHHGNEIEAINDLKQFMENVWTVFILLIQKISHFESKDVFIQVIEERKFT